MTDPKFDESKEIENSENSLAYRINDLENYYADNVLSDDLKEIYAEVQKDCEDFRSNVFFKNLDILEDTLGNFINPDKKKKTWLDMDREHEERLREIKSPEQLMKEFTDKADKH